VSGASRPALTNRVPGRMGTGKAELRRIVLWMLDQAELTAALARGVTAEAQGG
jgi:hypothetical protein